MSKPKYTYGDIVKFQFGQYTDEKIVYTKEGIVAIVDANGTWLNPGKPSYDILVKNDILFKGENTTVKDEKILYKHIAEEFVIEKIGSVPEEEIWK